MKSRRVVSIWEGHQDNAGSEPVRLEGARQGLTPKGLRNPMGLRHQESNMGMETKREPDQGEPGRQARRLQPEGLAGAFVGAMATP